MDSLSFTIGAGEIFGLVGANGAGKSATIMALAGLLPVRSGTVRLRGHDITAMPAHARVDQGIALVPEGRRVFADLTVDDSRPAGLRSSRGGCPRGPGDDGRALAPAR